MADYKNSFTKKVREEVGHHILKYEVVDLSKASFDKVEIKKDLRIKFVKNGMLYNPNIGHHFEYRFRNINVANQTLQELSLFGISGKISLNEKKKVAVVYVADASTIMQILKLLGATNSLKEYKKITDYNAKVKETNREVNFETANIRKSVNAGLKQVQEIKKLVKKKSIKELDRDLQVVVKARLKYQTISLTELADKLSISKSALNHRLIKIRKLLGE